MADKNYRLIFTLSDGTEESVQFTVPQGEKGDKGDSGVMTVNGITPDENGNVEIPTGGGSSGGCTKTLLWTSPLSTSFSVKTLYLPIGGYDAVEILYENEGGLRSLSSSGEIPLMDGFTSFCNLFRGNGAFYTSITIDNNGKFTFSLNDNEYCLPLFIYGIKYANPVVQSDNALASAGFYVDKKLEANGTDFDLVDEIGWDVTGYIKVSAGDIIRLKNVTMPDVTGDSNRVFGYRSNKLERDYFSVRSTDTSHSPVFEDGNVVQFTVLESDIGGTTGYIRIGAKNIDKYSIITVNGEID